MKRHWESDSYLPFKLPDHDLGFLIGAKPTGCSREELIKRCQSRATRSPGRCAIPVRMRANNGEADSRALARVIAIENEDVHSCNGPVPRTHLRSPLFMSELNNLSPPASAAPEPERGNRDAGKRESPTPQVISRWIRFADFHHEPFRIFFPVAVLAGLIGVALWPVMLLRWTEIYPGPSHARLMVQGFFAGFIFGFLGTSMPRLVAARPLSAPEAFSLLSLFLGNVVANTVGMNALADGIFVGEILLLFVMLRNRCHHGMDRPPPSFVLVGLSFACAFVGTAIHLAGRRWELSQPLELFARLVSYHGFVLLCILGAGGFLLPRFLGLGVRRKYADSAVASPEWKRTAGVAAGTGVLIVVTFVLEALGWNRIAGTARAVVIIAYLAYEMPLEQLRWSWRGVQWQLIVGLVCIPLGVLAAGWFFSARLTWLHLELVGGFALITTGVATRVVFGHSGGRDKVERFHPWLTAAAVLMLAGLASRITGDFLPRIQTTHYFYGAACWMAGAIVWAICVLPRVLRPDPEG